MLAAIMGQRPKHIDLRREEYLAIEWEDGTKSVLGIAYLRRMSPSADARTLRESMARNPLTVLPSGSSGSAGSTISAIDAELVGNYALRIRFSDGHDTGIYTWQYLREIADDAPPLPTGSRPGDASAEPG